MVRVLRCTASVAARIAVERQQPRAGAELMTLQNWNEMLARSVLAGLAPATLVACGSREPATDADRLARGKELVHQMSAKLAAATAVSVTTTETRDVVRGSGRKEPVSLSGVYTMRRPDRLYTKATGDRGL